MKPLRFGALVPDRDSAAKRANQDRREVLKIFANAITKRRDTDYVVEEEDFMKAWGLRVASSTMRRCSSDIWDIGDDKPAYTGRGLVAALMELACLIPSFRLPAALRCYYHGVAYQQP
ncbi:unnamed protein product [Symbiodinium sp. CCMP2456]|nr:unnamed protein product [Symbiodinium sp. CCMP2456]